MSYLGLTGAAIATRQPLPPREPHTIGVFDDEDIMSDIDMLIFHYMRKVGLGAVVNWHTYAVG